MPKFKGRKSKVVKSGRKTEIVEMTFKKLPDGTLVWKLGDVEGDSFSDTIETLCEANVTIKLEILPDHKQKAWEEYDISPGYGPDPSLRYWRGQVIGQVK